MEIRYRENIISMETQISTTDKVQPFLLCLQMAVSEESDSDESDSDLNILKTTRETRTVVTLTTD